MRLLSVQSLELHRPPVVSKLLFSVLGSALSDGPFPLRVRRSSDLRTVLGLTIRFSRCFALPARAPPRGDSFAIIAQRRANVNTFFTLFSQNLHFEIFVGICLLFWRFFSFCRLFPLIYSSERSIFYKKSSIISTSEY